MDILMLGTGNAFAKKYFNNNALLFMNGFTLMIDCGITAPLALHRTRHSLEEIDAIIISHIHADHIGGLEEIAYRMKFIHNRLPVLYVPDKLIQPLWEHSLKGGLSQENWQRLEDYFDVRPIREGVPVSLHEGLTVELIRTEHVPGKISYSMLFNDRFFYSADMKFHPDLVTDLVRSRGCIVFHDCQFAVPGEVHATLAELLTLPDDVQANIYLMHYSDDRDQYEGRTGRMTFVDQHVRYTITDNGIAPSASAHGHPRSNQ